MSNTISKIREMSQKAAQEKVAAEQKRIEDTVSKDIEVLNKILEMIKDGLVYKEVKPPFGRRSYQVVTEEVVLEDYSNKPEYGSGTKIEWNDGGYYGYPHTVIMVNGHVYSHAADMLRHYKYLAEQAMKKLNVEREAAKDRLDAVENLLVIGPAVKEIMTNYDKHLAEVKKS